ncbi:MAG: 4'-phosphopantetheinyl transferase superfamily protein [Gemmatimonadaceae bacterium]
MTDHSARRETTGSVPADLWGEPPDHPSIHPDAVHVWNASLLLDADTIDALRDTLTPDERDRADRFHFRRHRDQFIAARGILRSILGRYLSLAPELIRFDYSSHGKPALAQQPEPLGALRFNLSHADDVALIAIARDREIGVDVERIREGVSALEIAERFFSAGEVLALRDVPEARRAEAFFNCWTRKEAYVKALGAGLSHDLGGFTVSVGTEAALLHVSESAVSSEWTLVSLVPSTGYAGAFAVSGAIREMHTWRAPGASQRSSR